MDQLILYNLPYDAADLEEIARLLRGVDPIIAPWGSEDFDQYSFPSYAEQRDVHHCELCALLDLNIILDIVRLAERKPATESMQRAAALLAFLIVTDTQFDVGPGSTEFMQKQGGHSANENLRLFRIADNVHPRAYVDIALGRRPALTDADMPVEVPKSESFAPEIHHNWHLHYIALLKLTLISIESGSGVGKFLQYLEWMWSDFMFSGTAFVFAALYLSPKPPPRMIKGIGSGDPELILAGLRNATWDLVLAHYWVTRARESINQGRLWIFCTFDKALRDIASNLLASGDCTKGDEKKIEEFLSRCWSETAVLQILRTYGSCMEKADDPRRAMKKINGQKEFLPMIGNLEQQIRSALKRQV